jgi:hypothetical protein
MTPTLYLDMDGVVADFDAMAAQHLGRDLSGYTQDGIFSFVGDEWPKIQAIERFYRDLPPMKGCWQLVDTARQYRDRLGWRLLFLTAIPRLNDMPWAQYDKILWVNQHFPDIAVHFGPYSHDKQHHCRPGDILVDDRLTNCIEWRAVGGRAFHVVNRDVVASAQELEQNFQQLVESAAELQAQLTIF